MRLALGLGTRTPNAGQPANTPNPAAASHDSVRQRRRFAQDGDVPVVMLHRARDSDSGGENKLAALTAELREERASRVKAERALEEANHLAQSLMTKLKHAEMALEDKRREEGEAHSHVDALLLAEREARHQAEIKAGEATLALSLLERKLEAASAAKATLAAQPIAVEPMAVASAPDLFGEHKSPPVGTPTVKRRLSKRIEAQTAAAIAPAASMPVVPKLPAPETTDNDEDKPIEWWLPSFRATRKAPVRRKRATS